MKISVVITADLRTRFIREAVQSVINQTMPRSDYEIVVVKRFDDPELDQFLRAQGCVVVPCGDVVLGAKHELAAQRVRGDVVCILEDDDRFLPEKLERVWEAFSRDLTRVVYFHNPFTVIDETGRPAPALMLPWMRAGMSHAENISLRGYPEGIRDLKRIRYPIEYNLSSFSLRSDVYRRASASAKELGTEHFEPWFFYNAMITGPDVRLLSAPTVLTEYRQHSDNARRRNVNAYGWSQTLAITARNLDPFIARLKDYPLVRKEFRARQLIYQLMAEMLGRSSRRALLAQATGILPLVRTQAVRRRRDFLFRVFAATIIGEPARRGYRASLTGRRESN